MIKIFDEFKNKLNSLLDAKKSIDELDKIISDLNDENMRLKNKISNMEKELNEIIEKIKNNS